MQYNPYQASNHINGFGNNGYHNGGSISNRSRSTSPDVPAVPQVILTSTVSNSSIASPRGGARYSYHHVTNGNNKYKYNKYDKYDNNKSDDSYSLNRAKSTSASLYQIKNQMGSSFNNKYVYKSKNATDAGTPKPDFLVKRRNKNGNKMNKFSLDKSDNNNNNNSNNNHNTNDQQQRRRIFSNEYITSNNNNGNATLKASISNGYHTSPEFDGDIDTATEITLASDVDTETDTELSFDALKSAATNGHTLSGGYLSDGTALSNANNNINNNRARLNAHAKSNGYKRKKKIKKSYKRSFSPNANHNNYNKPRYTTTSVPVNVNNTMMVGNPSLNVSKSFSEQENNNNQTGKFRPNHIVTDIDENSTKAVISKSIDKFNRKKKRGKHHKRKYKEDTGFKRHSVGHTDSSTLGELKARYDSNGVKKKNLPDTHVKWHRSTSFEKDHKKPKAEKRRRSLFNGPAETPLDPINNDNTAFDTINSQKWDVQQLLNIETEQEFHHTLASHSKEDIIELCWDLLRSKDKSDDLLRMVSVMNTDLEQVLFFCFVLFCFTDRWYNVHTQNRLHLLIDVMINRKKHIIQ